MTERDKAEEHQEEEQSREVEDLEVTPEEADDVKGGKVHMQDFHFVMRQDKSSP